MDILKEISISIITFKNVKKIHKFARIIAINTYGVFLFYYFPILLMYFILKYIKINKKLVLYFIQFYVLLYITLCAQKLSYSFIKYYLVSYLDFWNTFIQYISFMFFHGPIELLVHVIAIYILYNNIVINHKNTEIQTLIYLTLNKLCKLKFILFGLIVLAAFIEYNTSFDIKKIIF
ncbi:MAG: hypothetical protein M0R46_16825 [Candidatus Muirbacterium halophilum]|nr:hypothetical protein [Candidatus Muirbacterium halophilum]MCK9477581.1 hypothetical protein [Candidatus Muirbacterium halophilum]